MTKLTLSDLQFKELSSTEFVRNRSRQIFEDSLSGGTHFQLNLEKLPACARMVRELIVKNYPDLKVPFHSRWEHFQVGGVDRVGELERRLAGKVSDARAHALIDLVVVSVLLDAGAGSEWRYLARDQKTYDRSEGLAVASLEAFESGLFSSDANDPFRVDAVALKNLRLETFGDAFQSSERHPLVGLEGRFQLMKKLGSCLEDQPHYFAEGAASRPGHLLGWFKKRLCPDGALSARTLVHGLLWGLGDMWPERFVANDLRFGDAWIYPQGAEPKFSNVIAFHKLSQWLSYSLIYPLEVAGIRVSEILELTGLPEYRNGGLFIDTGVLTARDPGASVRVYSPQDDFLIEWRALTVCLLDEVAKLIRIDLAVTEDELPLGKILQGGTWLAGRATAAQARGGLPPFKIQSDGTVF